MYKGVAQGNLTSPADAVATYDEVVRRFGEATEPGIRELVAMALVNKGNAQGNLTSPADPVATYEEVVRRFGEATEPGIRKLVGNALNGIAFVLLCEAKATWKREGRERANEALRQAAERAGAGTSLSAVESLRARQQGLCSLSRRGDRSRRRRAARGDQAGR